MAASGDDPGRISPRSAGPSVGFRAAGSIALAVIAIGCVFAPSALSATPGLVAAYGFDAGSGSIVSDASGLGNDGTIAHASWTRSGMHGAALRLNGSGPGVIVRDSSSLHLTRAMTLEAWVDPSAVDGQWRDVVSKGNENYFLEASSPPAGGSIAGNQGSEVFGAARLETGRWTYLALTYNGRALRLFVNGREVSSVPQTGRLRTSNDPLELGGDTIYGQGFQGRIDDVRVYNVALTTVEIRSDMKAAVSGAVGDTKPPSAPGALTAASAGAGEIDLSWGASTDNAGVTGYQVERCQGTGCTDFARIASVNSAGYKDASVAPGTSYRYRVRAVDAAGNVSVYSNTAEAATRAAAAAPPPGPGAGPGRLHVDPTGRYLVDQSGTPFLMTGDSPQALISDLTESDAALFFSTRRAQGFNTVWINLLCDDYTGCRQDGATWDGIPPFTTPGDLSTPNEAYFSRVDQMIQLAGQYGFVVLLDPIETGGWLDTLVANGVDKDRAYGQYVGRRYAGFGFSNIIWISGNDYQAYGPDHDPYVTAVAQGIRSTDPSALQTVELDYFTSGSLDDPAWAPLIDLNSSYTYEPTYVQVLNDYNRSNFLPTFLVEGPYEDEQNVSTGPFGSPDQLRRQEYWSLLSGATGQLFGNHSTWQFLCSDRDADGNCVGGWKDQLASVGAMQMANVVALFASRPWYQLVPDQDHNVVTSGYGTFGTDDYVTAARTPDRTLAIAYVPSARTLTVDLSTLSGPVTARWYDPTNGTYTAVGDGPFSNTDTVSLATPGSNAGGDDDWVLVLEAS